MIINELKIIQKEIDRLKQYLPTHHEPDSPKSSGGEEGEDGSKSEKKANKKNVLVFGASRGIGKQIAINLSEKEIYNIYLFARSKLEQP